MDDSGSVEGWYHLIEATNDIDHPEFEELVEWAGGPIRAAHFDLAETDARLEPVRRRMERSRAKALATPTAADPAPASR